MVLTAICVFMTAVLYTHASVDVCIPIDINIRRIQAFNDKRVTESPLWTTNLPRTMCFEKCHLDSPCISVNFSPETETCIGFGRLFEGLVAETETVQGYQLFETVPSFVCTTNEYCWTNFGSTHCYENRCRCDIGYSLDGVTCRILSECVTYSSDYSVHPGYVKYGHDFTSHTVQTASSCGNLCVNHAACKTADFDPYSGTCWLGDTNWFEEADPSRGTNTGYTYIQRECSW